MADSTGIRRVAQGDEPTWSPDGTRIAFQSNTGISLIQYDGTGRVDLRAGGYQPAWSPDGALIAFRGGGIRVMTSNGFQERLVVDDDFLQDGDELHRPAWSADGQRIAFVRYDCCWMWPAEIYIARLDGSAPTNVIPFPDTGWYFSHWSPAWSPDGRSLAFIHNFFIVTGPVGSTSFQSIAVRAAWESKLDWSPDGQRLLFSDYNADRTRTIPPFTGDLRLFAANASTGAVVQIVPEAGSPLNARYRDFNGVWSPVVAP